MVDAHGRQDIKKPASGGGLHSGKPDVPYPTIDWMAVIISMAKVFSIGAASQAPGDAVNAFD